MGTFPDESIFIHPDDNPSPSAWMGHIPFGIFIVGLVRPRVLVELGTHYGHSYFSFCRSVLGNRLLTRCYAVDTWAGDKHAGTYGDDVYQSVSDINAKFYSGFSNLLRMTFDEAVQMFSDGSVDLLHIDGLHTYEAVKHDFETWLPKLSESSVVLIHDTNERTHGFGVWRFWEEISKVYPHIHFPHSHGLGVVFTGKKHEPRVTQFIEELGDPDQQKILCATFERLGQAVKSRWETGDVRRYFTEMIATVSAALDNEQRNNEGLMDKLNENVEKLQAMSASLKQCEEKVVEWQIAVAQKETENFQLNGRLASLQSDLEEVRRQASGNASALESALTERDTQIATLESALSDRATADAARDVELREREALLEQLLHSRSWVITSPLRGFMNALRAMRHSSFASGGASSMGRFMRAVSFAKKNGLVATVERIRQTGSPVGASPPYAAVQNPPAGNRQSDNTVRDMVSNRFVQIQPLPVYSVVGERVERINLVTDSINAGSLFGGVGTAIILGAEMAQARGARLRIVTRNEKPNQANVAHILKHNSIELDQEVEFEMIPHGRSATQLCITEGDIFLTTSWWTTKSVMGSVQHEKIVYLLQEDERMFYPLGDDYLRCEQVLSSRDLTFVINTKLLYTHLIRSGLTNLESRAMWFEPAFPSTVFYREPRNSPPQKRRLLFYARPNNVRNLFWLGIETLDEAISRGVLDLSKWDVVFVGKDIPKMTFTNGYSPIFAQNLSWAEYGELVRRIDIGLCLMYTPHPSYPPLDLVSSGAVVVTNQFGIKTDLDIYSRNLLCAEPETEALVRRLIDAMDLVSLDTRDRNYESSNINRSWHAALETIVADLKEVR